LAEIARLERQHVNQQAVLRRKAEEAAAANNRLKEMLLRQKSVADDRMKKQESADLSGIGARVRVCIEFMSRSLYMIHDLCCCMYWRTTGGVRMIRLEYLWWSGGVTMTRLECLWWSGGVRMMRLDCLWWSSGVWMPDWTVSGGVMV